MNTPENILHEMREMMQQASTAADKTVPFYKAVRKSQKKACLKFIEEANEAMVEALRAKPGRLISESADMLEAFLVMLCQSGVDISAVMKELARRYPQQPNNDPNNKEERERL